MTLEIFYDPCYFDMWCVRDSATKDFNMTLHFSSTEHAEHAKAVIEEWIRTAKKEALLEAYQGYAFEQGRDSLTAEIERLKEEIAKTPLY